MTTSVATTATISEPADQADSGYLLVLESTVTQDCPQEADGVTVLAGPYRRFMPATSPRGLGLRVPGALTPDERILLDDESRAAVSAHAPGPMALTQLMHRRDGERLHVEALVLPIGAREQADLEEMIADTDVTSGRGLAWEYVEELLADCRDRLPDGRLPVHDLAEYDPARLTATPAPIAAAAA